MVTSNTSLEISDDFFMHTRECSLMGASEGG